MSDINVNVTDQIINVDITDQIIDVNVSNAPGPQGPAGPGVPAGGTAGQILIKESSTDYDTGWSTTNADLGEFGLKAGYLQVDTTPTNTPGDQGTMYWDDQGETVALIMNGTVQKVGEDIFYHVKNQSGSSIPKGTAVRFAGTDGNSGKILIEPFLADGTYPSFYYMGITAEDIDNGDPGKVYEFGKIRGVNTSAYQDGDILYASSTVAGGFQTTAPAPPNNIIVVAAVINAANNGTLMIRSTITDAGNNIYNSDGTLTGNRTVTQNGNDLRFDTKIGVGDSLEISDGGDYYSIYIGADANHTGSGEFNVGIGYNVDTHGGDFNTVIGAEAFDGTNGEENTVVGGYAMSLNYGADPSYNVAVGYQSLYLNQGNYNTGIGYSSLFDVTTGTYNIGLGTDSGKGIVTGSYNTIIGSATGLSSSLSNNIILADGQGNIRFRDDSTQTILSRLAGSGTRMVTAGANGELSTQALPTSTNIYNSDGTLTGNRKVTLSGYKLAFSEGIIVDEDNFGNGVYIGARGQAGDYNIAIGDGSLESITNGNENTSIGYDALRALTSGDGNTAIGYEVGYSVTTGSDNTLIGYRAGAGISTGSYNTVIGKATGLSGTTSNNVIIADGQGNIRFRDDSSKTIINRLAGTGTRLVVADADGGLSATLTNPITGTGTSGQVAYFTGSTTQAGSNNLFWDNANARLGIGLTNPSQELTVKGTIRSEALTGADNTFIEGVNIVGTIVARMREASSVGDGGLLFEGQRASSTGGSGIVFTGHVGTGGANAGVYFLANGGTITSPADLPANTPIAVFAKRASSANSVQATMFSTGNLLLQNGGTFTDGGQRLQVQGTSLFAGTMNITVPSVAGTRETIFVSKVSDNSNDQFGIANSTATDARFVPTFYGYGNGTYATMVFRSLVTSTNDTGTVPSIVLVATRTDSGTDPNNGNFTALTTKPLLAILNADTYYAQMFANGNLLLQSGGTYTDNGYKLDIQGTLRSTGNTFLSTSGDTAIGTTTLGTATKLTIGGSETASSAIARGTLINTSLTAAANNDVLVGLDVNPTFSNGAFTGVSNFALRVTGLAQVSSASYPPLRTIRTTSETSQIRGAFDVLHSTTSTSIADGFGVSFDLSIRDGNNVTNALGGIRATRNGANNTGYLSLINSSAGTFDERVRVWNTGNVTIQNGGTFTDAGFRLDVNGTARVQDNFYVNKNQNADTLIEIRNTTAGTGSRAYISFVSDTASNNVQVGKRSSLFTAYKILSASDGYMYNGTTAGDISILNDFATGKIKFAAGGSSTVQMELSSGGNLGIGNAPTAAVDIKASTTAASSLRIRSGVAPTAPNDGDIWFDGTDLKIRIGGVTKTFTVT